MATLEMTGQYVLPEYGAEVEAASRERKKRFLAPFFTNLDRDVYALTSRLPDRIKAALVARQSRALIYDARELLWLEFVTAPELGLVQLREVLGNGELDDSLDEEKAGRKIRNIIDSFGDDSVREQASAYVMFQNMSVLATTLGVVHPLLTRIEASTRYINWGQKENGRYRYKDLDFGEDEDAKRIYETAMEICFSTYGELWQPVWDYVVAANPRDSAVSEEAYFSSVRGKVCDNLRGLLPLSALTNFGLHGDLRAMAEMIMNLRAAESAEMRRMGDEMCLELAKVNPEFVAVANSNHGQAWTNCRRETEAFLKERMEGVDLPNRYANSPGVGLEVLSGNPLCEMARSLLLSRNSTVEETSLNMEAERLVQEGGLAEILAGLGQLRHNRRHELPEFLRNITLRIRLRQISFGSLKDLFRHRRILSRSQPDMSGQFGCHIPRDIAALGGEVLGKYKAAQKNAARGVKWMRGRGFNKEADYCLTHGTLTSFDISCDLLEAYWISELRSIASGFEEYRWFAQELWREMLSGIPGVEYLGSFTNMEQNYPLGRIKEAVRADLAGRQ